MIRLYQFPPAFGLPFSVSQFCTKLELYFRLTGRAYEVAVGDPRKSPNKQLPYVELTDGRIVAETADVIAEMEIEGPALDQGLSAAQLEAGEVLTELAQGPVYFACLYARFAEEKGWEHQKPTVRALVPKILAPILVPVIRRSQIKRCHENRFTNGEGYAAAIDALTTISETLGDKSFMLGEDIHTVDCAVWANVVQAAHTLSDNPVRQAIRNNARLVAYIERVAKVADWQLPARNEPHVPLGDAAVISAAR